MSISNNFPGENTILHVGIGYLDELNSSLGNDIKIPLIQAMANYIRRQISFQEAQNVFFSLIGRDEPLQNLKEIIEMPDDPLNISENDNSTDDESSNLRRKTRPWTALEDARLLAGIYRYGVDNWTTISNFIGNGRTRAQCCQRWARGLNPRISKELWSYEEDLKLIDLVRTYGDKSWTKIASLMGNRSDVQCRYHYYQVQRDLPSLFQDSYRQNLSFPNISLNNILQIKPNLPPRSPGRYSLPDITVQHNLSFPNEQQIPLPIPKPIIPPKIPNLNNSFPPQLPPIPQPLVRRPSLPLPESPFPNTIQSPQKLSKNHNSTSSLDGFLRNFLN